MKVTSITRGGQISIPATVRRRWATDRVVLEEQGDRLIIRPIPADPIGAALRSLKSERTSDDLMTEARADDAAAEQRRVAR
jgi:bifunctional DNA-binding transcriptional regulator/antitoxin component of YhaV-PrlF toxin-antitoxin module